eukprot:PhM_4_TR10024/c4_g1_i3/m.94873
MAFLMFFVVVGIPKKNYSIPFFIVVKDNLMSVFLLSEKNKKPSIVCIRHPPLTFFLFIYPFLPFFRSLFSGRFFAVRIRGFRFFLSSYFACSSRGKCPGTLRSLARRPQQHNPLTHRRAHCHGMGVLGRDLDALHLCQRHRPQEQALPGRVPSDDGINGAGRAQLNGDSGAEEFELCVRRDVRERPHELRRPAHGRAHCAAEKGLDVLAHRSAVSVRDLGHSGHRHTQVAQRDAHQRRGEDVLQRRAALGVQREHGVAQTRELGAALWVHVDHGAALATQRRRLDLLYRGALERVLQREQLVQHDAHGEDVRLLPVGLVRADLRREVVRRAAEGAAGGARDGHVVLPREAEVAQLQQAGGHHEDVLRLDVAVHHVGAVDVVDGEAQLREDGQSVVLAEVLLHLRLRSVQWRGRRRRRLWRRLQLAPGTHLAAKVAARRVFHQQQDRALVLVVGDVADDVGVVAVREALDLVHGEAALVLAHELHVEHLGDVLLVALRHDPHLLVLGAEELLSECQRSVRQHWVFEGCF